LTTTALFLSQSLRQWLNKDTQVVFFFSFHSDDISMIIFLFARPLFILKRSRLGVIETENGKTDRFLAITTERNYFY